MSTRHQYTTILERKTLHQRFKATVKSKNPTIVEVVASLLSGYIQQEPHRPSQRSLAASGGTRTDSEQGNSLKDPCPAAEHLPWAKGRYVAEAEVRLNRRCRIVAVF
jgi:hypothetical protein